MDLIQELISSWSKIIDKFLDDIELTILRAYILFGELSLYKVSHITGLPLSTTYKKAKRLIELGLIEQNDVHSFRVTIKGILQCIAQNCDNPAMLINKIRLRWRINASFEEICTYLIVLAYTLKKLNITLSNLDNFDSLDLTSRYILHLILTKSSINCMGNFEDILSQILELDTKILSRCKNFLRNCLLKYIKSLLDVLLRISGSKALIIYNDGNGIKILDVCSEEGLKIFKKSIESICLT